MRPPSVLPLLFSVLLLSACSGTPPSASSGSSSALDSTQAKPLVDRIEETPDSLATLPRPLFYRSTSPLSADPLRKGWSPTPIGVVTVQGQRLPNQTDGGSNPIRPSPEEEVSPARAQIEAIGGLSDGAARMGLRIRTVVPDSQSLREAPFVDLFTDRMMLRRGEAWRTLHRERDSLYETRFVPLSVSDLQRLLKADTVALAINHAHFRLPPSTRSELTALYAAVPDSLFPDTTGIENRLTVFHSPDAPPRFEGGVNALGSVVEYPLAALRRMIEGTVR